LERGCVRSTSRSISASDDRFETPGALRLVFQTQPRSEIRTLPLGFKD
jgi:hypothetical protein